MGQKPKTTIELNGKRYVAITGEVVDDAVPTTSPPTSTAPPQAKPSPARVNSTGSLGGVVTTAPTSDTVKPTPAKAQQVHTAPKHSETLNRQAISSPNQPAASHTGDPKNLPEGGDPARRKLAENVDPARNQRASQHSKSTAITKFSAGTATKTDTSDDERFPVIPDTEPKTTPAISPKEQLIAEQMAKVAANQSAPAEKKPTLMKRLFKKLKGSRTNTVTATSLAALLLIGYVTYLNIPRMALRLAAGRAGFSAELPGYSPSGFRFSGPVAYSPGELTLKYSSNTDDRAYTINEQETNWDSQTLLDSYVLGETQLYSTYQQRGLTIYVYDGSTATWVNGGIWFTVGGDSALTSEQLLKIAASL